MVISGILNSKSTWLSAAQVTVNSCTFDWKSALSNSPHSSSLDLLISTASTTPNAVIVDCTSSLEIASNYPKWLSLGLSIVTPNKKGLSGDLKLYQAIQSSQGNSWVYHESTVGAGLPVISTLKDLIETGDSVIQIEGILSGTLSFLFNSWSLKQVSKDDLPFSHWVELAKAKGYTEPDPRDDLNGIDVARKVLILSRLLNLNLELNDIPVENIVPLELRDVESGDSFIKELPKFNAHFEA